jgi:all-trans-8'-apo-beta-carotenal 15,15'-oxygenase
VSSTSLLITKMENGAPDADPRKKLYWEIGPTLNSPNPPSLPQKLVEALETNTHPVEKQSELGNGVFVTRDWRKAWHTYESPVDDPTLIDPKTGYAQYVIDEIEGMVPDDLVGVLYRNGPGKFGVDGDRVQHVLDADGLVVQVSFPPPVANGEREFKFQSRFVETDAMKEEEAAGKFLYRGTFGTAPVGIVQPPKKGLNEDPWNPPMMAKVAGNAFKTNIKNSANTQVISFGGKVLALFEAGLPHRLDPETLETLGEDTMGGILPKGKLPVKISGGVPEEYTPSFIGGAAHTAHPNICPDTGNLVGWHWSQLVDKKSLEATFTEWSPVDFSAIASKTFELPNCELAPHDMALTENCIMLKVNSLKMNQLDFLSGLKGPAASLAMDGRSNVTLHVFPRPTAKNQFEPYIVEVPACFSIHFSHAYEDEETGNIVAIFSGWPPSDSKDFLGAWGGFAPLFSVIPTTLIWKLEIDPVQKKCVHLGVAPGAANACAEHPLVHPNFSTKKAKNVYAVASNFVGDSTAPCGYCKLLVEDGDDSILPKGEKNEKIDAWWFGTRSFAGEPLIVPKYGSDPSNEDAAYLLGMVQDSVKDKSAIAIFDLEKDLKCGPVSVMWLKSSIPPGLHGCFAQDGNGSSSVFC